MVIEAAKEAYTRGTLKHMVLSSVLNTQIWELEAFVDSKRKLECALIRSAVPFTICQEAMKLDDFLVPSTILGERKILPIAWRSSTKLSFISRRDLGEVCLHDGLIDHELELTLDRHTQKSYLAENSILARSTSS